MFLSSTRLRTGETLEAALFARITQSLSLQRIKAELERPAWSGVRGTGSLEDRVVIVESKLLFASEVLESPSNRWSEAFSPSVDTGANPGSDE